MDLLTRALKVVAGDRMKDILARLTSNRVVGAITGALVTAIVNSSSVTTVILVGFVSAGLLSMAQCVGVIMGANIGSRACSRLPRRRNPRARRGAPSARSPPTPLDGAPRPTQIVEVTGCLKICSPTRGRSVSTWGGTRVCVRRRPNRFINRVRLVANDNAQLLAA